MKLNVLVVITLLLVTCSITTAQENVCKTNHNAPPSGSYAWVVDAEVKVYFFRDMFTSEQREALVSAMDSWTKSAETTAAGVKFTYAGETDGPAACNNCLLVTKQDVRKSNPKLYAFFSPLGRTDDGLLTSAWIVLDNATTDANALQSYMAHELGHGMGLWNCSSCKKKQSIMREFPRINGNNGLTGPSPCDLEVVRQVYRRQRGMAIN